MLWVQIITERFGVASGAACAWKVTVWSPQRTVGKRRFGMIRDTDGRQLEPAQGGDAFVGLGQAGVGRRQVEPALLLVLVDLVADEDQVAQGMHLERVGRCAAPVAGRLTTPRFSG